MAFALLLLPVAVVVLLVLYLLHVNKALAYVPKEALALSPNRFTDASIWATYERIIKEPIVVELPPKTGRKYIVVGGAGFLPGWIVLQLLARGEDPKRIRIVDICPPTRRDLTTGAAADVAFVKADVTDADAVTAAFTAPWPDTADVPITVFHSAANIRFWERAKSLLPISTRINVKGTQNVVAASLKIGASTLVYTSSGSIAVKRFRFWVWPWERYPKGFVQVLNDESPIPARHSEFFSNYAASKAQGERLVRRIDRSVNSRGGILRTGCIRPGNGIFGTGDVLAHLYLVNKENPTWIKNILQSFVYVENCALAHLLYEQRLLEMDAPEEGRPDIGGQAFCVADPNPPISFGDINKALSLVTRGEVTFPVYPPGLMLVLAHIVEAYYVIRLSHPLLTSMLPGVNNQLAILQPALFSLTQVHLVFDDSRARKSAKEGGLGYKAPYTSLEALCQMLIEYERAGSADRWSVKGDRRTFTVESNMKGKT